MARFPNIDAELLMQKLSRMIDYCEKNKDKKFNALNVLFQVGDAIMDCPTADVAPKSEVASMPHKCKDCAGCTQWKCDCSLIEDNAKTEVAREILEELEMAIHHAIGGWKNEIRFSIGREKTKLIAERVGALQYCLYEIAELKKKYTGEQT